MFFICLDHSHNESHIETCFYCGILWKRASLIIMMMMDIMTILIITIIVVMITMVITMMLMVDLNDKRPPEEQRMQLHLSGFLRGRGLFLGSCKKTLPKAQRTRGLSSYHKFLHKSSNFNFKFSITKR